MGTLLVVLDEVEGRATTDVEGEDEAVDQDLRCVG
jgi:hypothetical protein